MKTQPKTKETNSENLIERFNEDCNLRGMASATDYLYRIKEFCAFLEARDINPLNASRDDLKAFLGQLKVRDLKAKTNKPDIFMPKCILRIFDSGGTR